MSYEMNEDEFLDQQFENRMESDFDIEKSFSSKLLNAEQEFEHIEEKIHNLIIQLKENNDPQMIKDIMESLIDNEEIWSEEECEEIWSEEE